jgi:hypothetical protein
MKQIITLLIIVLSEMVNAQEVDYHLYSPTASSWDIVEFSLYDTTGHRYLLKETIDDKGRVTQLEFLKDGKLINDPLCYLVNRVTFEYFDNKIVETLYHNEQVLLATDCEMHFRTIYHLDDEGYIEKTESDAKYDFSGIEKAEIEKWKEWVPERKIEIDSIGKNLEVEYYYHSSAKMNGIYPINRNYKYIDDYYYGDEPENFSILKGIGKLKN